MRLDYDKEINILNDLHELDSKECLILSDFECSKNYNNTTLIIDSILKDSYIDLWEDNSCSNLPPDFINKEQKLMMEVMRFDDHSKDGINNPVLAKERKMADEVKELIKDLPNVRLHVIAKTDLPTEEDHNYQFLYTSFQRTIRKHLSKLKKYKSNFPGYKSIFLALNESSGNYFESVEGYLGRPHLIFLDNRFIKEFIDSDLDYLIMFLPYNHFETLQKHEDLPRAVIFDVRRLKGNKELHFIDYDETKMMSNER